MRRIIIDCFEIIHSEELPNNCVNYTKKKLGTQVLDLPDDVKLEDMKDHMKDRFNIVLGEIS